MAPKHNMAMHRFFANLPMIAFFFIMLFVYVSYMTTYLGKLLTNGYTYDQDHSSPEGYATLFLTMKTITSYTEAVVNKLQSEEIGLTSQEQKGTIYFAVSHVIIVLFLISVLRVIFTRPGTVPVDWSTATEAELYSAAEAEKLALLANWKKRKHDEGETRLSSTPSKLQDGYDEEQDRLMGQGAQGEEIGRKTLEEYPDDPQMMEQLNQMAFLNAMKKENKRFCGHCQLFKPPRTHHCRQCNTCVLKMDHHCPWVGNCVGFRNYKFFINMVFFGVILLWFFFVTYTEIVSDTLFNAEVGSGLVFWVFLAYVFNAVLALVITGFFCFHCWIITQGKTTLELVEEKKSV